VEGMSVGMIKMIDCSDAELKGMGVNGLNLVKEKFTWPTIAAQMDELYQWVRKRCPQGDKPEFIQ
jgi:glycosyltransferase involved in cell wall biosynthesis